jgi:hypothetical protein
VPRAPELAVRLVDDARPVAAASQSGRTVGRQRGAVGLFGDGSSTTSAVARDQLDGVRRGRAEKSSSRCPTTQPVIASRAYSGYIE